MSGRASRPVTQGDVHKICKGATDAGLDVHRVEVSTVTGIVILFTGDPANQPIADNAGENPWDEVLDQDEAPVQ